MYFKIRVVASAVFTAFIVTCGAVPAFAQATGTENPGRIEQRFKPPPTPKASPEISIPGPEAPLPPAKAASIHFTLTGVVIDGASVFSQADLAPLYQNLLGHEVTLAQIYELRDAITAKYRKAGFVLSQAIIPPQKIAGGIVHIRVVEGYIDHVEFQGKTDDDRGLIREMAEKITESRPLNVKVLERYVLLVSDLPGISVRTVIKPAKDMPGAADLVFILSHALVSGDAEIDNRGSEAIGPEQGQIGIDFNSIYGQDEQTSFLFATTGQPKELQYGRVASMWVLDPEGSRLTLSGSYSRTNPSGQISVLNPTGWAVIGSALFDYPAIRSRSENLNLGAGLTYENSVTKLLGQHFSDDRIRYLSVHATYDAADTFFGDRYPASNIIEGQWYQGLNILDETHTGSIYLSRGNAQSDFSLFTATATRIQSLIDNTSLAVSASGQVSDAPLVVPMQFGLGGSRFGRGYEPSELTGDEGVAASVEARYDIPFFSDIFGHPELYAFYDVGQIWNIDALPGTFSSASLASAGGGIRFTVLGRIDIDFELAKPLTRAIASRGNKDVRPLFNISTRF